jgi:hypothetical protein
MLVRGGDIRPQLAEGMNSPSVTTKSSCIYKSAAVLVGGVDIGAQLAECTSNLVSPRPAKVYVPRRSKVRRAELQLRKNSKLLQGWLGCLSITCFTDVVVAIEGEKPCKE